MSQFLFCFVLKIDKNRLDIGFLGSVSLLLYRSTLALENTTRDLDNIRINDIH